MAERTYSAVEARAKLAELQSRSRDDALAWLHHCYSIDEELIHCESPDVAMINHCGIRPNIIPSSLTIDETTKWVAARDIEVGEELECDYTHLGDSKQLKELYSLLGAEFTI